MKKILITGGAGFVGSSLALQLKSDHPTSEVICLDNLRRSGSALNLPRLKKAGIKFMHGDIRIPGDIKAAGFFDLMVECSAEPSALAGFDGSPDYLLSTNLTGTMHCLEACRRNKAALIFLSTSRVYPWQDIRELNYVETATRLEIKKLQQSSGVSFAGIDESFPLHGARTLYGATKLASELLIMEYADMYGLKAVINRCGVLTGPWQMGKVDQGFMVLWVASHIFHRKLSYIGFGGSGKQLRDLLHVRDLYSLLRLQLDNLNTHTGKVYNVGGGAAMSISLMELTELVREITSIDIPISSVEETRPGDIPWYISDTHAVEAATGWKASITPREIVVEIYDWLNKNSDQLQHIL